MNKLDAIRERLKASAPEDCWAGFLVENFAPGDIALLRNAPADIALLLACVDEMRGVLIAAAEAFTDGVVVCRKCGDEETLTDSDVAFLVRETLASIEEKLR